MKTLIVYDTEGYIIQIISGDYRIPTGVPYLELEVPVDKTVQPGIGVDVSVTPHKAILIDALKSETEILSDRLGATEEMLLQIMLEGMM